MPQGPVPPDPNGPRPDETPVDPYIHAVESANATVTAQIDASGTRFDTLTERNFPRASNPQQVLKTLAAAIDGGHQALIDRFLGVEPNPETRQRPPKFVNGRGWAPAITQLSQLVTTLNGSLPTGTHLTIPSGDAKDVRIALHTQIAALSPNLQPMIADAIVDSAYSRSTASAAKLQNKLRIALQLAGLQLVADQANSNITAAELDQPGRWAAHSSEVGGETRPSSVFEELVTGGPKGIAYTVDSPDSQYSSDFDGIRLRENGGFELVDSKGDYRRYVPGTGVERLQGESRRQIRAADGRPIVWVSQFGGDQLAGLRTIVSEASADTPTKPATPFTVTHETDRRPPPPQGGTPPAGGTSPTLPPHGPTQPPAGAAPDLGTGPENNGSNNPNPSENPQSDGVLEPTAPGRFGIVDSSNPTETGNTDPADPNRPTDPSPGGPNPGGPNSSPGHPVSPIRGSLVMNLPGTSFHGDAAGRVNTDAVADAIADTMSETLHDNPDRGRIADAAGFQEIVPIADNVFTATTHNGNDVQITLEVGTTPTTQDGDRPLALIERTSENPNGSTRAPEFTITMSDFALAEHVGQALAEAIAQVSALTDGHTTRESVLHRRVDVEARLTPSDFSIKDIGTVGTIRYLQHSIDATHGKHRLQDMHIRHLVNVLNNAGMMMTRAEISTLNPTDAANAKTPAALNRLLAVPRDIQHVVLAANIDPNSRTIPSGMPSKGVFLARGMLQHGVAGLASGITVTLAGLGSGQGPLSAVRGGAVFIARVAGGVAQARGEFVQAVRKAWGDTHNSTNSILKGGQIERAAEAFLDQAQQQLAEQTGQSLAESPKQPRTLRPDTPKVPSIWATAGRYGSAGLTSELVNVASYSAAHVAHSVVEQVLAQTLTGTPGALLGAVSTIVGEQYLLNATENQGGSRKAADNAVDHDVAASIRDIIDITAAVHTTLLDARGQQIDNLVARAADGETISQEAVDAIGPAPTFDETMVEVTSGIQQAVAIGPDAEAELVTLVEKAEKAQTTLRTVMKTPSKERLELHAKLVELGMQMPDTIFQPDASTPAARAQAQAQAERAWVHKWLGLQTPDLADRLARMSLRPTAVASLGSYELKNLLSGGVSSASTMATFGVITGLNPLEVGIDALITAAATTLVGGGLEHGVQTAVENRTQLTNPKTVHQKPHKVSQFRYGIDATTSIIEHIESQQQARIDELLGIDPQADQSPELTKNVRAETMRVLLQNFGTQTSSANYLGGVNHYGSRILGGYSASSVSFAGLTGDSSNLIAGLTSAISAHFGEGLIKNRGQSSGDARKSLISQLTSGFHSGSMGLQLEMQRGELHSDEPSNVSVAPPPRTEQTPFQSDIVEDTVDRNTLQLDEAPPTITTVTIGDMTLTVDLENQRATIIDRSPPSRTVTVPDTRSTSPEPSSTTTAESTTPSRDDGGTAPGDRSGGPKPPSQHSSDPTPPADTPHDVDQAPDNPPRRNTNFVRGAQWRRWWWVAPVAPFVLSPTDRPIEPTPPADPEPPGNPDQPDGSTEPDDSTGQPVNPPTQPEDSPPSHTQPPTSPADCRPPTQPPEIDLPPVDAPNEKCGGQHRDECGLTWRSADERALECAIDAAREAARLMGMRMVELEDGSLLLELPDGSHVRILLESFTGGEGEALIVERDGDVLTVRINSDASVLDIALDAISGITALGRYGTGAPLEPSIFGGAPQPPGTPYSINDFQQMARLELLLNYLDETCCTDDTEALRLLITRELDRMGIADGDPHADRMRALLPDELRGTLLEELGTWAQMDAEHDAVTARHAGDNDYWEAVETVEEVSTWPAEPPLDGAIPDGPDGSADPDGPANPDGPDSPPRNGSEPRP